LEAKGKTIEGENGGKGCQVNPEFGGREKKWGAFRLEGKPSGEGAGKKHKQKKRKKGNTMEKKKAMLGRGKKVGTKKWLRPW